MNKFIRQKDLVNYKIFNVPITVIGVGGIGSFTVLTLAKMGFRNITIYDHDRVEQHNLPNQFYRIKDLKKYKVDALADLVYEFEGLKILEARPKIIEKLQSKGLVEKIEENYKHVVKTCYKCGTLIEPQIKDQWFVKMKPLAAPAVKAVKNNEIKFIPLTTPMSLG